MSKLSGIRVVDLSLFLPGPMMTSMLADHGAEIIKIEPPGGDPARQMEPFEEGQSVWFRNINRGKQSVVLDLKQKDNLQKLYGLVEESDIFVEAFRPGVANRLEIDYETLSAINPRIIYCSISAFGQDGPLAHHPAHDLAVEAFAGFMSVNDKGDGEPVVPAFPAADASASLVALSGILMALIGRERTGIGDYLDIAMYDSLLPWCGHFAGPSLAHGEAVHSATQRSLGGSAFYNVYKTKDDRHIVLGGRESKFVKNLLKALKREDLIDLCLGPPGPSQNPAKTFLQETFITRSRDEWVNWFKDKDVCFAPVLDFVEGFSEPQLIFRQMLIEGPKGQKVFGSPIKFKNEPGSVSTIAPKLDEHGSLTNSL